MAAAGGEEEVPEHFSCPVCFEVPDSEVYQCLDGHVLCRKCYFQLTECPQSRIQLDTTRPIRNRYFEGLLESIKVKCENYYSCGTKLSRREITNHEESCCYNFDKFGYFVTICKLMGHPDCDFNVNNGNTEDAVQHFISVHGCVQSKKGKIKMELTDIGAVSTCTEIQIWTPIISDLQDKQCFILTMAVLDPQKESVAFLSIFLPYTKNPNRNKPSVRTSFTISYGDPNDPFTWTSVMTPAPLGKISFYLPSNIASPFQLSWLKSHSTLRDSILIDYKTMSKEGNENDGEYQLVKCAKYSSILDPILPAEEGRVVDWNRMERSPSAQALLDKELEWEENKDRGAVFAFIKKVFESEFYAFPGIVNGDMEWLRYGCYFLAARFGTVNAMQYILNKGLNCNVINDENGTPLHCTMYDKNKKIGLRKAKLLVEQGKVDPRRVSFNKTLLHWAVFYSTPETLKYFIDLGLDVNQEDKNGNTPFRALIECRAAPGKEEDFVLKMAKMLLDSGADCDRSKGKLSDYDIAVFKSFDKIQDMILSYQSVAAGKAF